MSIFTERNHLFLRDPGGGVEDVQKMADAGFGAIFCNVGDFGPSTWDLVRSRAEAAEVVCGPWLRPVTATFGYDEAKVDYLIEVADDWDTPGILNVEKEIDNTGATLTASFAQKIDSRDFALSCEAYPFWGVDWSHVSHLPVLPQIFPQEVEAAKHPYDCRQAWYARGINCVVFTFGAYWGQSPDTFDRLTPYGLYTADDVQNEFQRWASLGTHLPCLTSPQPEPEKPMPPVDATQARASVVFDAQAWEQNQPQYTPKARLTVCRRIAQEANTDAIWNQIRDSILSILDNAGLPK